MTTRRVYILIDRRKPVAELEYCSAFIGENGFYTNSETHRVIFFDLDIPEPDNLGAVKAGVVPDDENPREEGRDDD